MSVERQTISALKWTGAAKLIGQLVNWAITLIVVRLLAPQDYGLMALSLAVITVLSTVAELGLGASLVQAVKLGETELARINGAVILLNFGVGVLLLLFAPFAAWVFGEPRSVAVIQLSSLQFVFVGLSSVPQALLIRDLHFRRLAGIEMVAGVLTNLSTLVLAWLGAGVWALVAGYQTGAAVRALLLLDRSSWIRPQFQLTGIAQHLRFGGALTASRVIWQVSSQVDVLIASRFLGSGAVGVYSVALNLATMPMQKIMSIVNQVAFPAVARLQTDPVTLRRHLTKTLRLISFVGVPLAWGLGSVAPEFVLLVFGPKWSDVTAPLQVLCLIIPLRMLGSLLVTSAVATGSASSEVRNTVISIIVLPPAFLIGVQWGVTGLAWAWVVGIVVCYAVVMPRISVILGIRLRDMARAIYLNVAAGLAMCAVVFAVRNLVFVASLPARLAVLVASGALAYVIAISIIDRSIWHDCKDLLVRDRGSG